MPSISCCTNKPNALPQPQGLSTCQKCVLVAVLILGAATIAWAATALANPTKCPTFLAKSFEALPQGGQIALLATGLLLLGVPTGLLIKDRCKQQEDSTPQNRLPYYDTNLLEQVRKRGYPTPEEARSFVQFSRVIGRRGQSRCEQRLMERCRSGYQFDPEAAKEAARIFTEVDDKHHFFTLMRLHEIKDPAFEALLSWELEKVACQEAFGNMKAFQQLQKTEDPQMEDQYHKACITEYCAIKKKESLSTPHTDFIFNCLTTNPTTENLREAFDRFKTEFRVFGYPFVEAMMYRILPKFLPIDADDEINLTELVKADHPLMQHEHAKIIFRYGTQGVSAYGENMHQFENLSLHLANLKDTSAIPKLIELKKLIDANSGDERPSSETRTQCRKIADTHTVELYQLASTPQEIRNVVENPDQIKTLDKKLREQYFPYVHLYLQLVNNQITTSEALKAEIARLEQRTQGGLGS